MTEVPKRNESPQEQFLFERQTSLIIGNADVIVRVAAWISCRLSVDLIADKQHTDRRGFPAEVTYRVRKCVFLEA